MLYHPDKHRDPELKSQAEQLFNQVHQAYEGKDVYTSWNLNHLVYIFIAILIEKNTDEIKLGMETDKMSFKAQRKSRQQH